ncbi:MAG: hypothetical protein WC364_10990 [Eubacteriales bacterium]|jgi:hypothetical protein
MAFDLVKTRTGASAPMRHDLKGTSAESFAVGEVVYLSNGYLTMAYTCLPAQFIVAAAVAASTVAGSTTPIVPVYEIPNGAEYRVISDATVSATSRGTLVTISTYGLQPTATASTGYGGFMILETDGSTTSTYSKVRGTFPDYRTTS